MRTCPENLDAIGWELDWNKLLASGNAATVDEGLCTGLAVDGVEVRGADTDARRSIRRPWDNSRAARTVYGAAANLERALYPALFTAAGARLDPGVQAAALHPAGL